MSGFYTSATFTIDGVAFPVEDCIFERKPEPEYGCDLSPLYAPYEVNIEIPVKGSIDDFAALIHREPPGASAVTLARRVKYGGRKGRSAWRRLLKRAPSVELDTGLVRLRGRAVTLDETEIMVQMSGRSGRGRR